MKPRRRFQVSWTWQVLALLLSLPFSALGQSGPPKLSILEAEPGRFALSWPTSPSGFVLESVNDLSNTAGWAPWTPAPSASGGLFSVTVTVNEVARFFRLHQAAAAFQIRSVAPTDGATDVGVTVRPQVVFTQPVKVSSLTSTNFYASFAGQPLPATIVPASDGSFAWLFFQQPMPGGARVQVTVDGTTILSAADGTSLDADGDGQPGGIGTFEFATVSLQAVAGTSLSGIIVDPGPDLIPRTDDDRQAGPDGLLGTADDVFLLPIQGVQVHLIGREDQVLTTETDGRFHFDSVPVGDVKVVIDGNTATQPPDGMYFPEMVIDAQMLLGKDNWTMTNGPEVYLPRLSRNIFQGVTASVTNQIVATPDGAPSLSAFQRNELSIDIPANSLIGPNGQPLAFGQIGISTVPADVVRDMLPPGVLQHTFDITVQAPGVATFATPAPMSFPNVFNAAPGTKLNFLSFDHTTGRLVIEGTATVSADGASVRTDPGTGVTHPGWHGLTPPGSQASPSNGPPQCTINLGPTTATASFSGDAGQPPRYWAPASPINPPKALPMITGETGDLSDPGLSWTAPTDKDVCGLKVEIQVDGPLSKFMQRTGNLQLKSQTFTLRPGTGKKKTFTGKAKTYDQLFGSGKIANFLKDVLYGAQIKVRATLLKNQGPPEVSESTFYLFRWVNVTYPPEFQSGSGQTMAFRKTLNDGTGGYSMFKQVLTFLPAGTETSVEITPRSGLPKLLNADFSLDRHTLQLEFDPDRNGVFLQDIALKMKDGQDTLVGQLVGRAEGVPPVKVDLNALGYEQELKRVIESLRNISLRSSFGFTVPTYIFSEAAPGALPAVIRTNLIVAGRSEFGDFLNLIPGGATNTAAGKDGLSGTADDVSYNRFVRVSGRFESAFGGFMPGDRGILGPDGVAGSPDDKFSQQQEIDLGTRLDAEAIALAQAVSAQFSDVNATADALQLVNRGGDITVQWTDLFTDGGSGRESGPAGVGIPVFGLADFDADRSTLRTLLMNPKLPLAAKFWVLSDNLNRQVTNSAKVAVAINIAWDSASSFAEYVANSVSHELGHTFGLLDAYTDDGKIGGTAACNKAGNCIPYDIMRNGQTADPYLGFAPSNLQLLRAATGVAPGRLEEPLLHGLKAYRKTFNLASSSNGIRENAPADPAPAEPEIAVAQGDQFFFGEADEEAQNAITAAADSASSSQFPLMILNQGYGPLVVASVTLADGSTGFSLDPSTVVGTAIPPGGSLPLLIQFSPRTPGEAQDTVVLKSNADGTPELHVPLLATAIPKAGTIAITLVGNNNLGGAGLGELAVSAAGIFQIANLGLQPLQIKDVRVLEGAESFQVVGLPSTLATQPIVLTNGGQFTFGASFSPAQLGLLRAKIEIESNDQTQPTLQVSVVGTGMADAAPGHWGNDFVAMESPDFPNGQILRTRSDDKGNFAFFVPAETFYHLAVFDPSTGLIGDETDLTASSGVRTFVAETLVFMPSQEPDTDYDGLPDDIEFAIGTDPNKTDTDGDGLDDYTEVLQGLDPLSGQSAATGIIGVAPLNGSAQEVVVFTDAGGRQVACVAAGLGGLALVDVTEPAHPIVLSQLPLAGASVDVAFDPATGFALVAAKDQFNSPGALHIVDVSDPNAPRLIRSVSPGAIQVEALNGYAYVASAETLRAINEQTGSIDQEISLTTGWMARDGNFLYVTDGLKLQVIELQPPRMVLRGSSQNNNDTTGKLFAADGILYATSVGHGAYYTWDVSDPDSPHVISQSQIPAGTRMGTTGLAVSGGGKALLIGMDLLVSKTALAPNVTVFNAKNPTNTFDFVGGFPTGVADQPYSICIASGAAFIAHGSAGLVVLNYHSPDRAGVAPSVQITQILPQTNVIERSTFLVRARVTDDVEVRSVELLLNGLVVARVGSFPYVLPAVAPSIATAGNRISLQVRATDTAGNVGLSAPLILSLVADAAPTVAIQTISGLDPTAHSIQIVEGDSFTVQPAVADDTRVTQVELLINGQVVAQSSHLPFDLTATAPNNLGGPASFVVQVRATDTAGLVTLSGPATIVILPDTTPPALLQTDPSDGGTASRELEVIRLFFSEPLSPASLVPANFQLLLPSGQVVLPVGFSVVDSGKEVDVQVAALQPGDHQFTIHRAQLTDRAGNPLASSDLTIHFTVLTYSVKWNKMFAGQWLSGSWFEPTNWVPARVPRSNDWVLIDVPDTNVVVGLTTPQSVGTAKEIMQPVHIRNLISNRELDLVYVDLSADNTIQVDAQIDMSASKLSNTRLVAQPHTVITRGEKCCSSAITAEGYLAAWDDLTLEGDFQMGTHGGAGPINLVNRITVNGTLYPHAVFQFYDDATIGGSATLTNCDFDGSALQYRFDPAAGATPHQVPITVTLDTNVVLRGNINIALEDAGVTFINRGQILSEVATDDPTLRFNSSIVMYGSPDPTNINNFVNLGSIDVRKGNRLQINGQFFTNRGALTVRQGGFLWLVVDTDLSKVVCESGAICELNGTRYVTPANAMTELSGPGTWLVSGGGQFQGGTVRLTDGAVLEGNASFSNVLFEGELHNYDMSFGSARTQQFPQYVTPYGNTIGIYTNATINGRVVFHTTTNWPGSLTFSHGSVVSSDVVSLNGNCQIEFLGPNDKNTIDYPSEISGRILIGQGVTVHGQTLTIGDSSVGLGLYPPVLINQGTILTQPGDKLRLSCAALTNSGVIHFSSDTVAAGLSAFTQTADGRLEFDLAGTTPGASYGQLKIGTTAALDGTLSLSLVAPFQPASGASFQLLNFNSATGQFSRLQTPPLATPGLTWSPQYNAQDFTLRVTPGAP